MEQVKKESESRMKKSIAALKDDFNTIRTGRASSALFEKIKVEYYEQQVPLKPITGKEITETLREYSSLLGHFLEERGYGR